MTRITGSNLLQPYSAMFSFIGVATAGALPVAAIGGGNLIGSKNRVDSNSLDINISAFVDIKVVDEFSLRVTEGLAL